MSQHRIIRAASTEVKPASADQSRNWFAEHWRGTSWGLGGLAASVTVALALTSGNPEVPTGINSNLPACSKKTPEVRHRTFEQPGAEVSVLIGNSDEKKVSLKVNRGADVSMEPSVGMIDITSPDAVANSSEDRKLRTYQAGDEIRTIEAIAAPNNETQIIVSKPCG